MNGATLSLVCGVFLASAVAAALFLHRRRAAARTHSPAALFGELCRAHALARPQRALLKQVAQQQRLSDAVRIFTEPQWLLQAQAQGAFRSQAGQLQTLWQTLFEKPA